MHFLRLVYRVTQKTILYVHIIVYKVKFKIKDEIENKIRKMLEIAPVHVVDLVSPTMCQSHGD